MLGPHALPGLVTREHEFQLPLNPEQPQSELITVFAREVRAAEHAEFDRPWLVFLQGGPGFPSPRPVSASGWIGKAVERYHVLLLDQRGTGRSTPITSRSLSARGDASSQAEYLSQFRMDRIVDDCEAIRRQLLGPTSKWAVLGQSFGGFCATHYLSMHPEGLSEVFITGGLPPLSAPAEAVYRQTYRTLLRKHREYFDRYPEDQHKLDRLADHAAAGKLALPGGEAVSVRRLQQIGMELGMSDGFESLHALLEMPWIDSVDGPEPSYPFLRAFQNFLHYDTNPIFAVLHEGCYTQGQASNWAADRVRGEFAEFSPELRPLKMTAEMIYPWQFEEIGELREMAEAAHLIAQKQDWPQLYRKEQLAQNVVPVAAAVYANDLYVDRELSLATADQIANCQTWLTSEYEHNGLRENGSHVLGHLFDLVFGAR